MGLFSDLFTTKTVGLDIGVSGIKAVKLTTGKIKKLVSYNRVPLPPETFTVDGEPKRREIIVHALRILFSKGGFTTNHVAAGAFGNSIIVKKIRMDRVKEDELKEMFYWEAEQYLPYSAADVNIDFAILDPEGSERGKMDVRLVAAKKDYIRSFTSIIEDAQLVVEVIDHQALVLGNVFEFNYPVIASENSVKQGTAIIDFGAGTTKVAILEGSKTVFHRELKQSGNFATSFISDHLGISWEEAEQTKIKKSDQLAVKTLLKEFNLMLVDEIARTIDFWLGQHASSSVSQTYYCGGGSKTAGLIEELESKLSSKVSALNPTRSIVGTGKKMNAEAIKEMSCLGAVAAGLALRTGADAA